MNRKEEPAQYISSIYTLVRNQAFSRVSNAGTRRLFVWWLGLESKRMLSASKWILWPCAGIKAREHHPKKMGWMLTAGFSLALQLKFQSNLVNHGCFHWGSFSKAAKKENSKNTTPLGVLPVAQHLAHSWPHRGKCSPLVRPGCV